MNTDLLRFIDSISRDKSIEKESVFGDLEAAMMSAALKAFKDTDEVLVRIDRTTGEIEASVNGKPIDMKTLGRIPAQAAKQVMMQRIREDERNSIFEEYSERVGTVVTGTVTRYEGGALTVNLGRTEAILPRSEQIPGETHHPGERIRAMILDVREEPNRVRIHLTQTHPDYIRRLFELEVPEVSERVIEIRELAREAGYRTKIAVSSIDSKVDAIGACVGVRGSRIRNIVDELGGEKIDIVRWNESSQVLITNALKPAEVKETFLCFELGRATVIVDEDQLSLAIGKRGQNVRLAARLAGWDIDILTPAEYDKNVDDMEKALKRIEGVEDVLLDKLLAMGMISLSDLSDVGADPLIKELELEETLAARIVEVAAEEAKRIAVEAEAAKKAAQVAAAAAKVADAAQEAEGTAAEGDEESESGTASDAHTDGVEISAADTAGSGTIPVSETGEPAPKDAAEGEPGEAGDAGSAADVSAPRGADGESAQTTAERVSSEEPDLEPGTVESGEPA